MADTKKLLSIGELAKAMNVSVRTLQYYDSEGLLEPSAHSAGGRRLYSDKDMVRLHQILSLKQLGFSLDEIRDKLFNLDSPAEVSEMLLLQKESIQSQIKGLQTALETIDALREEIERMDEVDFGKYADIISMIQIGVEDYWMVKLFDDNLRAHLREKYADRHEEGRVFYEGYKTILDETFQLQEKGIAPTDAEAIAVAGRWWTMIMEFTGGDTAILSSLMKFDEAKNGLDEDIMKKQARVDGYLGQALDAYFKVSGMSFPSMEDQR